MDKFELMEEIQTALINYSSIEDDIKRLIDLVQDFFGDPPVGQSCIKLAADKLEEANKK